MDAVLFEKSRGALVDVPLDAQPWRYVCLCDWIMAVAKVPYVCCPDTRQRCLERLKREASIPAPSARICTKPPCV
jgi:hypothetical protein